MKSVIKQVIKQVPGSIWVATKLGLVQPAPAAPKLQGEAGIRALGHRQYVGGMWEEIGKLQFDYLVAQGLLPRHYLCDVACGSLRAGVHFVRYLEKGHYLGLEKWQLLIDEGVTKELGEELYIAKHPQFVISSEFEFEKLPHDPDYALAQSLFTHLPGVYIKRCLSKLRGRIAARGFFFATFNESSKPADNPCEPHDHEVFHYTKAEMEAFGAHTGWSAEYIGDWNHPRRQMMVKYTPC